MKNITFVLYRISVNIKIAFYSVIKLLFKKYLIIDVTGVILTQCSGGKGCRGNGEYVSLPGKKIECCCDECGYFLCCYEHTIKADA